MDARCRAGAAKRTGTRPHAGHDPTTHYGCEPGGMICYPAPEFPAGRRSRMRVFRVWLAIALALGGSGCAQKVASIDVSPKRIKVYGIGSTQRLTARILDKKSRPIEQGSVSWSSSKPDVASVDDSGRVTTKGPGRTM